MSELANECMLFDGICPSEHDLEHIIKMLSTMKTFFLILQEDQRLYIL